MSPDTLATLYILWVIIVIVFCLARLFYTPKKLGKLLYRVMNSKNTTIIVLFTSAACGMLAVLVSLGKKVSLYTLLQVSDLLPEQRADAYFFITGMVLLGLILLNIITALREGEVREKGIRVKNTILYWQNIREFRQIHTNAIVLYSDKIRTFWGKSKPYEWQMSVKATRKVREILAQHVNEAENIHE